MNSKRIRRFQKRLIKEIPFFPNNKVIKGELLRQSLLPVLFHYIHWTSRFIPPRQRMVQIEDYAKNDHRWPILERSINRLLSIALEGGDLSPYLSKKAHAKGYTPVDRMKNGEVGRWEDKDFLLNTMGFHHLHLGENINNKGMCDRTNEVVFVRVIRDLFEVIAIFDHSVFCSEVGDNDQLNSERLRLRGIFDEYSGRGCPVNTAYIPGNIITTSGHPLHVRDAASNYAEVIYELDSKLDDIGFRESLYENTDFIKPNKCELNWNLLGMDLGLIDKENQMFVLRHGWM